MREGTLSPNAKKVIIITSIVVVLLIVLAILTGRSERIPKNPPGTVGNTAGNLNNRGLFCELNGRVYFANAFDDGGFYSMNVDESDIKELAPVKVCNILGAGNYLYYFQLGASGTTGLGGVRMPHSFNRCHLDGSKATSMVRAVIVNAQLVGDRLYMLGQDDTAYFFRINTDKKEETQLAKYIINPSSAENGIIYYNGTVSDHFLYAMNTATENAEVILQENVWFPICIEDYVYYVDPGNDYQLRRYSLSGQYIEVLTQDKVESYNIGSGIIYYTTMGDNPCLKMMYADGSSPYVIANGVFSDINMTSQYVYVRSYYEPGKIYHAPLGSTGLEEFSNAQMAAIEAISKRK